jgi:hypothetical protein
MVLCLTTDEIEKKHLFTAEIAEVAEGKEKASI